MANRNQRAQIARETVEILQRGSYTVGESNVSLAESLDAMRIGTTLYTPSEIESLTSTLQPPANESTEIEVFNATTLAGATRLIDEGWDNPLCLNFASAKNPGGGFQSGSQAQEEALARASGLYASLILKADYYQANRSHGSSLYTNHLIYSPHVPVFRSDDDALLAQPFVVSMVTSPAVNAGAVNENEPSQVPKIRPVMQQRIRSVLAVARHHEHQAIVLGAWGCGVFRNDPVDIASWFAEALFEDESFAGAFAHIVFAVLDRSDDGATFNAFKTVFIDRPL